MHILNCPPRYHWVAKIQMLREEIAIGHVCHKVLMPGPLHGHFDVRTLILDGMDRAADSVGFCRHGGPARRCFSDRNAVPANGAPHRVVHRDGLRWEEHSIALATGGHQRSHTVRYCRHGAVEYVMAAHKTCYI